MGDVFVARDRRTDEKVALKLLSTHDPRVVSHADIIYVLEDGQLQTPTAENTIGHGGKN